MRIENHPDTDSMIDNTMIPRVERQTKAGYHLPFSDDDRKEISKRYKSGERVVDLMAEFKCSRTALQSIAKKFPGKKKYCRQLSVDENAFSEITPESSYWAGFLLADGTISDGGVITLALSSKDREHVFSFKEFLKAEQCITDRSVKDGSESGNIHIKTVFSVRCKKMCDDLVKFGVVPRKTWISRSFDCNNVDFWRGIIDGDGFVIAPKNYKTKHDFIIGICGTYEICEQFRDFCLGNGIETKADVRKNNGIFSWRVSGKNTAKIAKILYEGAYYSLKRKSYNAMIICDLFGH